MLIISQDGDTIVNFNNVEFIKIGFEASTTYEDDKENSTYETYTVEAIGHDMWFTIGEYHTEEKAKKALKYIMYSYVTGKEYCDLSTEKEEEMEGEQDD